MLRPKQNPAGASRRIGQLIRLLSSDQPGEAAASAQALNRALISAGTDIHALAEIAEAQLHLPLPTAPPVRRSPPIRARRPDGSQLQMNEKIICDRDAGVFRACGCGGFLFTVMPGAGPHVAQLVCDACNRGGRWLSRTHFGGQP
jgi:hypothetical protein